jgi:hypothetical protein
LVKVIVKARDERHATALWEKRGALLSLITSLLFCLFSRQQTTLLAGSR